MTKQKGFTLIELLVVIAIIGILSSVVLASMNSARKKSRDARRRQDLKSVQVALEIHFDKFAAYPTSATANTAYTLTTGTGSATGTVLDTTAMSTVPTEPTFTGTTNIYRYAGSATDYCFGAWTETLTASEDGCGSSSLGTGVKAATTGLDTGRSTGVVGSGFFITVRP
ncbi:MAG: protein ral secretion pathway protein [Candidatus Parcubacteria bacterium]|jgi:prepilin-type N-terminal cleavage/methylation domain-containing protein